MRSELVSPTGPTSCDPPTSRMGRTGVHAYLHALHSGRDWRTQLTAGLGALRELLDGCDHVSTTVTAAGGWRQVVATDETARRADELQGDLDEGPAVQALGAGHSVLSHDLHGESRWPRWCRAATGELALGAALVVLLHRHGRPVGTLNLYSDVPGGLSGVDVAVLHALAVPLSTVLLEVGVAERTLCWERRPPRVA